MVLQRFLLQITDSMVFTLIVQSKVLTALLEYIATTKLKTSILSCWTYCIAAGQNFQDLFILEIRKYLKFGFKMTHISEKACTSKIYLQIVERR